jgi:hypothetical protein
VYQFSLFIVSKPWRVGDDEQIHRTEMQQPAWSFVARHRINLIFEGLPCYQLREEKVNLAQDHLEILKVRAYSETGFWH